MESLGRVNVYSDLLNNQDERLNEEIINLIGLNERILRNIEPLFLYNNDLGNNRDLSFQRALEEVIEVEVNLQPSIKLSNYRKLLVEFASSIQSIQKWLMS